MVEPLIVEQREGPGVAAAQPGSGPAGEAATRLPGSAAAIPNAGGERKSLLQRAPKDIHIGWTSTVGGGWEIRVRCTIGNMDEARATTAIINLLADHSYPPAQAIDAGTGKTQSGLIAEGDESAVLKGCAQTPSPHKDRG